MAGRQGGGDGRLGRAIHLARATEGGRLSAAAREAVLDAAIHGQDDRRFESLPALFTPTRKLAAAWALPLALAGTLFLGLPRTSGPGGGREGASPVPTTVHVSKDGDRVLFTIANGDRNHRVYRSTTPDRFDPGVAMRVTGGEFVDRLDDRHAVVFYRIE
jgi:hypothetical protein